MAQATTFSDLVTRLYTLSSSRELWDACHAYVRSAGFDRYCYHHYHRNPNAAHGPETFTLAAEGFPDEWVEAYVEEDLHEIDPIPRLTLSQREPLFWHDIWGMTADGSDAHRFIERAREADLGDGVAIRVDGMGYQPGYIGLGFGGERPYVASHALVEVQSAAQLAHLANLRVRERRIATRYDLSPREAEVLSHVVRGRPNGAIAETLGVSRHTVDTLMRRLFDKLGVTDRTAAAVRGLETGLVRGPTAPARIAA